MDESEINKIFGEIVSDIDPLDFNDTEHTADFSIPIHTEPIEHVRQAILDSLVDQLEAREVDVSNPDGYSAELYKDITECVNRDFRELSGLNFGETVIASGNTIFMLADEDEEEDTSILPIPEGLQVIGSLDLLIVTVIPAVHTLPVLHESTTSYLAETDEPMPTIPYGAAFILKDAYAVDEEGNTEPLPPHLTAILPLNYPQLDLRREV